MLGMWGLAAVLLLMLDIVSFAAKFLKVVALSSAEAEYAAASQTCREITFIRNVCDDLGGQHCGYIYH